jgi:hypothetical protein
MVTAGRTIIGASRRMSVSFIALRRQGKTSVRAVISVPRSGTHHTPNSSRSPHTLPRFWRAYGALGRAVPQHIFCIWVITGGTNRLSQRWSECEGRSQNEIKNQQIGRQFGFWEPRVLE